MMMTIDPLFQLIKEMEAESKPKVKPLFVFGTRHGTIYNITPSHLAPLPAIQLSVADLYENKETL